MSIKRFIRITLAVTVALAAVASSFFTGGVLRSMAAGSYQYLCCPESDFSLEKTAGNIYGIQFKSCQEIDAFEIYVAKTASGSGTSLTVELHEWKGSYGESARSSAIFTRKFEDFDMQTWLRMDCPAPAGEYVALIKNTLGGVRLSIDSAVSPYARTYFNASVRQGNILSRIIFKDAGGTLAGISENVVKLVSSQGTWVAIDELGRTVDNSYSSTVRENKTVGLFFHTWHTSLTASGTRNITEILREHPEIKNDYSSPLWGHAGAYHWNEPIWGYYRSSDEWVLRRQAELLADAGVDAVFFDNTNGTATFIDDVLTLLKVWSLARADGVNTPKISFMLPMFEYNDVAVQLREIYKKIYKDGLYQELWFYWKGKPLMVGYPGRLNLAKEEDKEIYEFFNYRVINHAQSRDHVQVQSESGDPIVMGAIQSEVTDSFQLWNWISTTPQLINRNPDGTPEEVAVAIAHNWCAETHLTAMNNDKFKVFGRHYMPSKGDYDSRPDAKLYGAYFQEQWEYALSVDPEFIWVTGWNEGVAGRFEDFWGVENAFPDNFSDEFSRDIEPSKGDLKDNYYYQLCSFIRKYKGVPAASVVEKPVTVDIGTGAGWDDVRLVYESYPGDTFDRDCKGYKNEATGEYYVYQDQSGRNDIVSAKASYDNDFVYFRVKTAEDITSPTDELWMRLLIDVDSVNGKAVKLPSWESFNYIVNRLSPGASSITAVERSSGGWSWEKTGDAELSVNANILQLKIPREALGLGSGVPFVLNFKWADNNLTDGSDPLELYTKGDTAPGGRFKYQFAAAAYPAGKDPSGCGAGVSAGALPAALAAGALALCKKTKRRKEK
ncbi:MAG: hypothetical protein K6G89_07305 [Clostridia bacterium]|nr:hypothetical protein [Clostridia bacterium]